MMHKHKEGWITPREAAQLRIAGWASIMRYICMYGAPRRNYYSKQPFVDIRLDHEAIRAEIISQEAFDMAVETDEWLQTMREISPDAYTAIVIRYVEREPGTARTLAGEDQVKIFKSRTGKGMTTYYQKIHEAERYVGLMLGVSGAF